MRITGSAGGTGAGRAEVPMIEVELGRSRDVHRIWPSCAIAASTPTATCSGPIATERRVRSMEVPRAQAQRAEPVVEAFQALGDEVQHALLALHLPAHREEA